ncbi:imidazoleglycerol-phosphate dehydratase [Scopulibacillus daqui]|uniref:Imidazoleglycerol-phosphate dehydratase n=1 Tax=Scopulibacillus daqui TaxID=1469162 RepID=A0ABS2PYA9_9BACL|nr:imidazoleglycerol-phosphate dehydratase HisB [Scopulibacillus daqui]MBM7645005.1 imidazoleglycerol-phosphate dehydratase [Scopulibacillus daqui]
MTREARINRKTSETKIDLSLEIDGGGLAEVETGVPFLNHMLNLFAKHGLFNLNVKASGDTEIDDHHTTEDVGICLGQAFREALGSKKGIVRYGHMVLPMDEALVMVAADLSDRPHFEFNGELPSPKVGTFDSELVHEFLCKLAIEARMNLHVKIFYGKNTHHIIEAIFKALGRTLDAASTIDPRVQGIPSTKGML